MKIKVPVITLVFMIISLFCVAVSVMDAALIASILAIPAAILEKS